MKSTIKSMFICSALCAGLLSSLYALEIPLDGGGVINGKQATTNIGYVDMEKIFAEHPMTKRMQDDFQAEIDKRRKEIKDMEGSIADLQRVIVSSSSEITQIKAEIDTLKTKAAVQQTMAAAQQAMAVSGSTSTSSQSLPPAIVGVSTASYQSQIDSKENDIRAKETGIEAMKQDIAKKKEEIAKQVRQNKDDLVRLEEKQTNSVLTDLYRVLEKIASEENITIIIDKNNVLYGQPGQDLTAKVRERLQGR